jgi:hypothetical protein
MSRFQFLMLRAVEGGASLSEASDEALGWEVRHPDNDLFEHRPYAAWEAGRHDADHEDHADHENDGGSGRRAGSRRRLLDLTCGPNLAGKGRARG